MYDSEDWTKAEQGKAECKHFQLEADLLLLRLLLKTLLLLLVEKLLQLLQLLRVLHGCKAQLCLSLGLLLHLALKLWLAALLSEATAHAILPRHCIDTAPCSPLAGSKSNRTDISYAVTVV